jgi:hypothetical protein
MTDLLRCQIRVNGHLSNQWGDWFSGLEIENQSTGEALLSGDLPDQATLYGIITRMRDLGLELISLNCEKSCSGEISVQPESWQLTSDVD